MKFTLTAGSAAAVRRRIAQAGSSECLRQIRYCRRADLPDRNPLPDRLDPTRPLEGFLAAATFCVAEKAAAEPVTEGSGCACRVAAVGTISARGWLRIVQHGNGTTHRGPKTCAPSARACRDAVLEAAVVQLGRSTTGLCGLQAVESCRRVVRDVGRDQVARPRHVGGIQGRARGQTLRCAGRCRRALPRTRRAKRR